MHKTRCGIELQLHSALATATLTMSTTLSQIATDIRNLDGRVSRYDIFTFEAGVVIHQAKYRGKVSIVKSRQLEADRTTVTKVLSFGPFLNRP